MRSDTGFFDPGLPGESVLMRFPGYGWVYVLAWIVVGVVVVGGVYQLASGAPVPALVRDLLGPAGIIGSMAVGMILFYTRWRVLVTDRRVMMRPGYFAWKYDEIRLEDIEAVAIGGDRLSLRGRGGRELSARMLPLTATWVAEAIRKPYGLIQSPDEPPEFFLEPAETIHYREPDGTEARLQRYRLPAGIFLFVGSIALTRLYDLPDWTFYLFFVPIFLLLPPQILMNILKRGGTKPWRLAITDRRLLARWDMSGGPYLEEIRLSRIQRVWYDDRYGELILDEPQRRVILPARKNRAHCILEALGIEGEGLS